jgi:hypothetical protein
VRAMAVWALGRLAEPQAWQRLKAERSASEGDEDVLREWDSA